jgi:hypothetical protein
MFFYENNNYMNLSYFGELGYLCIYVLPEYEKHIFTTECIIHTFSDYVDILMCYNKVNVKFERVQFTSGYRCCAWSENTKYPNLASYLKICNSLICTDLIGNLSKPLMTNNVTSYAGKILIFPRMRREGDYGTVDKKIYDEIIKIFSGKEIVLCGHHAESHDLSSYNLKHIELIEAINACKTADMCIMPDSGFASLLIASGVKKIIIMYKEDYSKQRDTHFHIEIYQKTAKWFNTDYYIVDHTKILDFLRGKQYLENKRLYLDFIMPVKVVNTTINNNNIIFVDVKPQKTIKKTHGINSVIGIKKDSDLAYIKLQKNIKKIVDKNINK